MSPFPRLFVAFLFSLERLFTAAILTVQTPLCEYSSSVILRERGDIILFPGVFADPPWGVPHLAGLGVARLRAAAPAHGLRVLCAACSPAMPLQRHRAGPRTQPHVAYGIRTPELRHLLHSRFRLGSSAEHRRARSRELESESPRDHRGEPKQLRREGEQLAGGRGTIAAGI